MKDLQTIQKSLETDERHDHAQQMLSEGKALQEVKTPYTTAVTVQNPRSMSRAIKSLMTEAKHAGQSFYYRWPIKKKSGGTSYVQGPSIDLAMAMARHYGNCVVDVDVKETHSHFIFKGVFIDLETGFTVPRLFRQVKSREMGNYDADRAEDMVFQIGHSKAQRNAIIKAMPGWLVEQLIQISMEAAANDIKSENIEMSRAKSVSYFEGYGVTQEVLESMLDKKADKWMNDDILKLRDIAEAIRNGNVSVDEVFKEYRENKSNEMESKLKDTVKESKAKKPEPKKEPDNGANQKNEKPPEKETGTENSGSSDDGRQPNPWEFDAYKNYKFAGLKGYFNTHAGSFDEQSEELKDRAFEKWSKTYPQTPFPFNWPEKETLPEPENEGTENGERENRETTGPEIDHTKINCPNGKGEVEKDLCDKLCEYRIGCPAFDNEGD